MGDDERTEFRFDFGGIQLELCGDRQFVEEMYRQVMEDVEEARRRLGSEVVKGPAEAESGARDKGAGRKGQSLWVHRTSRLMRKIYMVSRQQIDEWPLGDAIDVEELSNIYVDKDVFKTIFPTITEGRTLWAEFTSVGKQKIADATEPSRKALKKG